MTIAGRSIVVCRATHQAVSLLDRLAVLGATPVHVPLIEVVAPLDGGVQLRQLLQATAPSTWLAFTSANGVAAAASVFDGQPPQGRIAVVGRATAECARAEGWQVDFVSPIGSAAGLGESLPVGAGDRVIAPLAELASGDLVDALRHRSVAVQAVTAYRTINPDVTAEDIERIIESDAVLITAPSVIQRLVTVLEPADLPPLVAIGPTSAAATVAVGLRVAGQASQPSVDGLIDAVVRTLSP